MAHQDYVSRPQNKDKKKSPYKGKTPPEPTFTLKLKLILLLSLTLIGGFGYGLWTIKDNKPQPQPEKIKIASSKDITEKSLPTPPKEKWTYVDDLKNKKEVEVGQYEVKNKGPYKLQCGSFRTNKQAEVLKANIAFAGLSSQVGAPQSKNNTYYRVFLGPYARKREAEKDKHQLKSNNVNRCIILPWK
jgi:cell division protein FtsN